MKSSSKKILVKAKLKSPTEVYVGIISMIIIIIVIIKEILFNNVTDLKWWMVSLPIILLTGIVVNGRHRYKAVSVYHDQVSIMPLFSLKPYLLRIENLIGFEVYETEIIGGLAFNIKIITSLRRKIVFPRDSYKNYDEFISGLHKSELKYLGKKELNFRYKETYRSLLKWSAILIPILYGMTILLKMIK